jgi:hypothetical protein
LIGIAHDSARFSLESIPLKLSKKKASVERIERDSLKCVDAVILMAEYRIRQYRCTSLFFEDPALENQLSFIKGVKHRSK